MLQLVQFTGVHFPDLNLNYYETLNNRTLDLNVSTKKGKLQMTGAYSLKIRVIAVFF